MISVIIATYNCEKYIERSILSIFNQYYKNLEIILYDDGSTDNTFKLAEKTFEKININNVVVIKGRENRGCGYARKQAIQKAQGEFLAIQDGDDYSFPGRFEEQMTVFEKDKSLFCVGAGMTFVSEQRDVVKIQLNPDTNDKIYKRMFIQDINPIFDPTSIFKLDGYRDVGGYEEDFPLVPDYVLWRKALRKGKKFYNIQKSLVEYLINSNGNTIRFNRQMREQHKIASSIY